MQWFIDCGKGRLIAANRLKCGFIWRRTVPQWNRYNATDRRLMRCCYCNSKIIGPQCPLTSPLSRSAASVSILFTFWVLFPKSFSSYGFLIPLTFGILIAFFDVNAMKKVHYTRKHHNTVIKHRFICFLSSVGSKAAEKFQFYSRSVSRTRRESMNTTNSVIIASNRINAFVRPCATKLCYRINYVCCYSKRGIRNGIPNDECILYFHPKNVAFSLHFHKFTLETTFWWSNHMSQHEKKTYTYKVSTLLSTILYELEENLFWKK